MKLKIFIHDSWPLLLLVGITIFLIGQFPHRIFLMSRDGIPKTSPVPLKTAKVSFLTLDAKTYKKLMHKAGISWLGRSSGVGSGAIAFDGGLALTDPLPPPAFLSLPTVFFKKPPTLTVKEKKYSPALFPTTLAAGPVLLSKTEKKPENISGESAKRDLLKIPKSLNEKRKVTENDDRTGSIESFFGN